MSNKKFNLKILMLASWVLLFFAWIFFYAVTQRPTITFLIVLLISAIITIITVILERKSIITLFRMRFVHKAFFGILSLIIILAILVGLYIISVNFPLRFDLTQNKSYTVSQQTMDILSRIDNPLSIVVLRSPSSDPTSSDWRADLLLEKYNRKTYENSGVDGVTSEQLIQLVTEPYNYEEILQVEKEKDGEER